MDIDFEPLPTDAPNAPPLPAGDGSAPTVGNLIPGRASVFATPKDLANFRRNGSFKTGDNGVGAWGDDTTAPEPQVALPQDYGIPHNAPVMVVGADGRRVLARNTDRMPRSDRLAGDGNIDLNPAAAAAIGHSGGVDPVRWQVLDPSQVYQQRVAPAASPGGINFEPLPAAPAGGTPAVSFTPLPDPTDPTARGALVSVPDKRPPAPPAPETRVSLGQTLGYPAGQEPAWTNNPVATGAFDLLGRAITSVPQAVATNPFVSGLGETFGVGVPRAIETQAARVVDPATPEILSPDQKAKERETLINELADIRDVDAHGDGPPAPPSAREQTIVARLNALPAVRENPLTEEEQAAIASRQGSAAGMRADVAAGGGVVDESRRQYEGDLKPGEKAPLSTRIQRGLADTAATMVPGVGMLSLLANTDNASRDAFLADAAKNGRDVNSPEVQREADHAGDVGTGKTAAVLPAYMLAGGAAGKAAAALTPEKAGAIRAFLTSGATQTAAMTAASASVRALEGEDPTPTLEGFLSGDLPFGLHGAGGAAEGQRARQLMDRMRAEAPPVREESAPATAPTDSVDAGSKSVAETAAPRAPVEPTFAPDAASFLDGDGSALRVPAGETPPPELAETPHVESADGGRVYYDPGTHAPEDFTPPAATPDSDFAPKDETKGPVPETKPPEPATADGLDADALEEAYHKLTTGGMSDEEAARRLSAVESARDADHAVEQVHTAKSEEEKARRDMEQEQQADADGYLQNESGGTELLDAIADAGGLPTVGHPHEAQFRGELANIRSAARGSANFGGQKGVFTGRLFRKDAPGMDELVQRLRGRGFDFTGEDDLFQAVENRLRTGKPHFGFAEGNPDLEPRAKVPTSDQRLDAAMTVRRTLADSPDAPRDQSVVQVANSEDDLPDHVRNHPLASRAEAFWDPREDKVHVLPWNITDPARAHQVLRHELLHRGLKLKYGPDYNNILDGAARHASDAELSAVARDYSASLPANWRDDPTARRYVTEEALARRVEAGNARQGWTGRAVSAVRDLLRRTGAVRTVTENDLAGVLRRSVRAGVLGERQPMDGSGARASRQRGNNPEQGGLFETDADRAKREDKLARIARSLRPEPAFDLGDESRSAPKSAAPEFRGAARVEDPGDLGLRAEERGGQQALFSVRHEADEDGNLLPVRRGLPKGHALLRPTDTIGGAKRELQRDNWVRRVVEQGRPVPEGTRPVLYMMGGGSGAGKSTLRDRMLSSGEIPREGTAILDSDEFKKQFPEYATMVHQGEPAASTLAHRESASLLKRAFSAVLDKRANAVLDGTMSHGPYVEGIIRQAREAGYDVHAIGVTVHPETALERARARALKSGRDVPVRDTLDRVRGFGDNFERIAPLVDRWELHDNNGADHRPVASRGGGRLDIHDAGLYDDWQRTPNHDYEEIRRRFSASQAANRGTGRLDQGTPGEGSRRGAQDGLAGAENPEGTGGVRPEQGSRAGDAEAHGGGPDGRTGPVGESPRFSVKSEPSDELVAKAKKFLSFHFGASIEALEKKSPLADSRQWVKTATELGFKPPLEQKPFVPDAFEMVGASKPEDVAKIHDKAAKGWTFKNGLATKKLVDVNGKTVAVGQTQTHAANALLGQHAWSIVPGPGQTWHVVDDLGTSLFSSTNASEAYKAGVSKLLGELAVKKHMATFHPEADASPAPYVAPPSRVPTTKAAPDTAGRTSRGRELPPGLRAPPDPANLPSDRRLEEAERQAAAVPMKVNPNYGKPVAPDGRVSNLAEPQWRQVRTPLFKGFFGDWENDPANASKVLDGKGEPRVMYRGTKKGVTPDMRPNARRQIYLSESPEFSDGYGRYSWETFVNARKPWDYQNPEHLDALRRSLEADPDFLYGGGVGATDKNSPAYRERLQELRDNGKTHAESVDSAMRDAARGDWLGIDRYPIWEHLQRMMDRGDHDGVYITEAGARNLIVPEASQVKSATHNEGTFDPSNPDTRFSVRQNVQAVREGVAARKAKDEIAAGKDAGETRAGMIGRQAGNSVRLDFGSQKELANKSSQASRDLAAMPFIIEAGGDKRKLTAELAKVQGSSDPTLARDFAPVVQHAIDHFDRLDPLKANAEAIFAKQRAIERRHGINTPEVENYVARRLELPEHRKALEPVSLFGGAGGGGSSRYFAKGRAFDTLGDAIAAGYRPKSTNLADLVQNRIETGQRIVQQKRLVNSVRTLTAPDGRPIIGDLIPRGPLANGKTEHVLPPGYAGVEVGGARLAVHKQFAPVFKALYGDSAIRNSTFGRMALKWTAFAKHGTLVLDTFHAFRVASKEAFYGYTAGYGKGLSVLEYGDRDLNRAVAAGDLTPAQAAYARRNRPMVDELVKAGLNVGKVADNLGAPEHGIPGVRVFNQWLFQKLQRGATVQTALKNYERNLARFPERGRAGNARQTAKEMNEVFGNLGSQGLFKSKTFQDAARAVMLAPQWTESQFRSEARGIGQLARAPVDLARGAAKGRLRLGTVAQGQVSSVLALLAAGQVANYLSTGHTTDQNEDGHKLDIWIPGGVKGRGLWFSPFEMAAEYTHMAMRYHAKHEQPVDIGTHLLSNKLSPLARGVKDYLTGRDFAGRPYSGETDRIRASLTDALPFPMPFGSAIEKDPRGVAGNAPVTDLRSAADKALSPLGYRVNRQPGAGERQLLNSVGVKTAYADSPSGKMRQLAQPFRPDKSYVGGASEYGELKRALENDDDGGATAELLNLKNSHDGDAIRKAVGIGADGKVKPQRFTDSAEHEAAFLKSLTPTQKAVYQDAQKEHVESAKKLQGIIKALQSKGMMVGY